MKKILAMTFIAVSLSSNLALAGGAIGGGSGLVLEILSKDITRDQFAALVSSGAEDSTVTINRMPARVRAVNFQSKTVELQIEGLEEPTVLRSVDAEAKQ